MKKSIYSFKRTGHLSVAEFLKKNGAGEALCVLGCSGEGHNRQPPCTEASMGFLAQGPAI